MQHRRVTALFVLGLGIGSLWAGWVMAQTGTAGRPGAQENAPAPGNEAASAVIVGVYDPTGQSPASISWPAYPASPPPGFHWQHSGRPGGAQGLSVGGWVLVRDGYTMPTIR